jgi:FkbM family methyltransferase
MKIEKYKVLIYGFVICAILSYVVYSVVLVNKSIESFKNNKFYWKIHDKEFIKNANLKYFNKKILNYSIKQENDFLLDTLLKSPQNSVFLDIGAYNGDTSIYISKKLKEKNRRDILILAFEPNKKYSKLINQHSKTDNLNLKCISKVVSNKKGFIYKKKGQTGAGTMYNKQYDGEKYECDTLDNLLEIEHILDVFLMKIDVEGHEVDLLKGATQTLKNTKHIYIEMWNDEHFIDKNEIIKNNYSHNKHILQNLNEFYPIQKIEKNIYFKKK